MKKKILIILPIVIVACIIIILVIPKNNNIVETPQDAVETSEVSEPTPEPQPEVTEPETVEPEETSEKSEQTTEPETIDDGINSTHTDVELGEDEYQGDEATDGANINLNEEEQAAVNRIEENLKKKHPEWFTDTPSTGTGEGNYEHVGTPDSGELTNPGSFGSSGQDGINKDATVY